MDTPNPGYELPERLLAELEVGSSAMLFASGMAAATSVLCTLVPGDHVVAPKIMYWALRKWIGEFASSTLLPAASSPPRGNDRYARRDPPTSLRSWSIVACTTSTSPPARRRSAAS